MKVCIGLPTKDEIDNIEIMINRVRKACPDFDLIIFDEHSTDGTLDVAKKLNVPVVQRVGSGYGAGLKEAIAYTADNGYDVFAILDCDQTYPSEDLPKLVSEVGEYDFVVGTRDLNTLYPVSHRLPNKFHTALANVLFGADLKDINSGMWAINPAKFKGQLSADGFDFTEQINTRALKNKYKIKQMPIEYGRRIGHSKIAIVDGFVDTWRIIIERFMP